MRIHAWFCPDASADDDNSVLTHVREDNFDMCTIVGIQGSDVLIEWVMAPGEPAVLHTTDILCIITNTHYNWARQILSNGE